MTTNQTKQLKELNQTQRKPLNLNNKSKPIITKQTKHQTTKPKELKPHRTI